jgi:hypothetical protein
MPATQQEKPRAALTYLIYDRTNGRVLARFRQFSVETGDYCECDPATVLKRFEDDSGVMTRVTDKDPKNLAVLPQQSDEPQSRLRVSTRRKSVEPLPRLRLRSDRDVLEGDGKDSVSIQVDVVDENGRIMRDFQANLEATTSRGKVSEHGGKITLRNGQTTFRLTSTAETAARVQVRIRDPNGLAVSDSLIFRFE